MEEQTIDFQNKNKTTNNNDMELTRLLANASIESDNVRTKQWASKQTATSYKNEQLIFEKRKTAINKSWKDGELNFVTNIFD